MIEHKLKKKHWDNSLIEEFDKLRDKETSLLAELHRTRDDINIFRDSWSVDDQSMLEAYMDEKYTVEP